jgi:hypothetical protein
MEDVLSNMMSVSNIKGQGLITLTLILSRFLSSGAHNLTSRLTLILHAKFYASMVAAEKK